jgi:hypothetical protein
MLLALGHFSLLSKMEEGRLIDDHVPLIMFAIQYCKQQYVTKAMAAKILGWVFDHAAYLDICEAASSALADKPKNMETLLSLGFPDNENTRSALSAASVQPFVW